MRGASLLRKRPPLPGAPSPPAASAVPPPPHNLRGAAPHRQQKRSRLVSPPLLLTLKQNQSFAKMMMLNKVRTWKLSVRAPANLCNPRARSSLSLSDPPDTSRSGEREESHKLRQRRSTRALPRARRWPRQCLRLAFRSIADQYGSRVRPAPRSAAEDFRGDARRLPLVFVFAGSLLVASGWTGAGARAGGCLGPTARRPSLPRILDHPLPPRLTASLSRARAPPFFCVGFGAPPTKKGGARRAPRCALAKTAARSALPPP